MIKFICTHFEIDLTAAGLSFVEENQWFKDTLFKEYSLPFSINLTNELRNKMDFFSHHNLMNIESIYEGYLYRDGRMEAASLEIQSITGISLKMNVKVSGISVSTWSQKLSTLDLLNFELDSGTLMEHAENIINFQYPVVNYNFPMIFTDKYDTDDATFTYFSKLLNHYESVAFVENEIIGEVIYNRNIMQPLPYLLYVLIKGFEKAGLTLSGDILTDADIQKALIVAAIDYFNTSDAAETPITKLMNDPDNLFEENGVDMAEFNTATDILTVGRYRVVGTVRFIGTTQAAESFYIKYGDEILRSENWSVSNKPNGLLYIDSEINVTTNDIAANKQVTIYVKDALGSSAATYKIEASINPIRFHNLSGEAASVISISTEVNLKNSVPDMEFGELVKAVMNWKNFDLSFDDNIATMNYISTAIDRTVAVDLTDYESHLVTRKFNKSLSFELRFQDDDANLDYPLKGLFIDQNGVVSENYELNSETKKIEIKLLPLPKKQVDDVETSLLVSDDESHLFLAFYEGLQSSLPVAVQRPSAIFPELYYNNLESWYDFRIKTSTYNWEFLMPHSLAAELSAQKLIYAFSNYFIIKKMTKTRISATLYRVKIEGEKLL